MKRYLFYSVVALAITVVYSCDHSEDTSGFSKEMIQGNWLFKYEKVETNFANGEKEDSAKVYNQIYQINETDTCKIYTADSIYLTSTLIYYLEPKSVVFSEVPCNCDTVVTKDPVVFSITDFEEAKKMVLQNVRKYYTDETQRELVKTITSTRYFVGTE
jgi:hypothetical protein